MTVHILSYASDLAGNKAGSAEGPWAIQSSCNLTGKALWYPPLQPQISLRGAQALPDVVRMCTRLAELSAQTVRAHEKVLTLGGDHSCAIGTWSGVSFAKQQEGPIGLIWFDAHMDSHTFHTTPSQNIHGMPLAALLGEGDPALTTILSKTPKLLPQNVALIGARSFEPEEHELLKRLNIRIYHMDEVNSRGLEVVLNEAIDLVTKKTVGFGISIDLDGIDPIDAPGVGVPEADGIRSADFLETLPLIRNNTKFLGAEIVELNPSLDRGAKTVNLAVAILKGLL